MVDYSGSTTKATKATKGRRIMAKKLSTAMLTALSIAHSQGEVLVGDDQRIALLGMAGRVSSNTLVALHSAGLLRNKPNTLAFELTVKELTIKGLSALAHAGVISPEEYTATRRKWDEWMTVAHAEALELDEKRTIARAYGSVPSGVVLFDEEIEGLYAAAMLRSEKDEELRQGETESTVVDVLPDGSTVVNVVADELGLIEEPTLSAGQRFRIAPCDGVWSVVELIELDPEGGPGFAWCTRVVADAARGAVGAELTLTEDFLSQDYVTACADPQTGDTYSRSMRHGAEVVKVDEVRAGQVRYRFVQKGLPRSAPYSLRLDHFIERYSRVPR